MQKVVSINHKSVLQQDCCTCSFVNDSFLQLAGLMTGLHNVKLFYEHLFWNVSSISSALLITFSRYSILVNDSHNYSNTCKHKNMSWKLRQCLATSTVDVQNKTSFVRLIFLPQAGKPRQTKIDERSKTHQKALKCQLTSHSRSMPWLLCLRLWKSISSCEPFSMFIVAWCKLDSLVKYQVWFEA